MLPARLFTESRSKTTSNVTGRQIAFEFDVFDKAGESLGGNMGRTPRIFEVGAKEMLPALERAFLEMEEGESRSVVLSPEEAYGPVKAQAFREFSLDSIPEKARQVGRKVMGRAADGSESMFDVVAIRGHKVVLDMNHPLAGQTLRFEIKRLSRGAEPRR